MAADRPILAVGVDEKGARAALIAQVEGVDRLIADAQTLSQDGATARSVRAAIRELQQISGWRLLTPDDEIDASAVGATVLSTDDIDRIRLVLLAGMQSDLALLQTHISGLETAEIVLTGSLQSAHGDKGSPLQHLVRDLEGAHADAILIEARSRSAAATLGAMITASRMSSPTGATRVLFAGATDDAAALEKQLSPEFELHHVSISPWSAKDFRLDELRQALEALVSSDTHSTPREEMDRGIRAPTRASAGSKLEIAQVLASATKSTVCVVDVCTRSTSIVISHGSSENAASTARAVDAEAGREGTQANYSRNKATSGLAESLETSDLGAIRQWLPFDVENDTLRDYLGNRSLRPWLVPRDARDLLVHQAVARAAGQAARPDNVRADFLIATGDIATYPRIGQVALTLLDIAQPTTPCRLLVDRALLLSRLGALLKLDAVARTSVLSVLRADTFINVGVCLSLVGKARQGEAVAEVSVQRTSGSFPAISGESSEVEVAPKEEVHEIRFGTIKVIPLASRDQAAIRVAAGRRFSFGIDPGENAWAIGSAELDLNPSEGIAGGLMGLVVDARGRPLELARDQAKRQAIMSDWLRSVDAFDAQLFSALD